MSNTEELQYLLANTADSNRESFGEIYATTSIKLFGIVMRILNDRPSSEEALQETYMRIWLQARRYNASKGSPMAWMATTARNQALDRLRRDRTASMQLDMDDIDTPSPEPGPLDYVLRSSDVQRLLKSMDKLKRPQRRCIELAYHDGYTLAETARVLACPIGTAKSWTYRGLGRLKVMMNREQGAART